MIDPGHMSQTGGAIYAIALAMKWIAIASVAIIVGVWVGRLMVGV